MGKKAKKSLLAGIPAWALSLITLFVSLGLFGLRLPESIEEYIDINILGFIIYIIFLPAACFIICKAHPKSIWYTPFICNTWIIISLILVAKSNPELAFIILLSACIVLSVIAAIFGAKIGRRKINQVKFVISKY